MIVRLFVFSLISLMSSWSWSKSLVISTHPIYLIAKEITQGVEEPELLLGDQTGHDIQLTPVQRKTLQDASLIIWLGKTHEAPLDKLLHNNGKAISILDSGIVTTLPLRNVKGIALPNTVDSHVWLDPNNAVRIGFFIAALRSQQFPENKTQYQANAKNFAQAMLQASKLHEGSSKIRPYWAYHDAYQYLERSLNLKFSGALTPEPNIAPTAAQIKFLNDQRPMKSMCLLAEANTAAHQFRLLQPVVFQPLSETLQGQDDFVVAWKKLAEETDKCVLSARK